jgi:hypothetical protein
VEAIQRAERNAGADGERQRRSLRRFLKMKDLLEQRAKWGHDGSSYIRIGRKCS